MADKILLRFAKTCGAYHKGDIAGFNEKLDKKFLRQVAAEKAAEVVKATGKKGAEKIAVIGSLAEDGTVKKAAKSAGEPAGGAPKRGRKPKETETGDGDGDGGADNSGDGDGTLDTPGV